jgi:hypothetical protein
MDSCGVFGPKPSPYKHPILIRLPHPYFFHPGRAPHALKSIFSALALSRYDQFLYSGYLGKLVIYFTERAFMFRVLI